MITLGRLEREERDLPHALADRDALCGRVVFPALAHLRSLLKQREQAKAGLDAQFEILERQQARAKAAEERHGIEARRWAQSIALAADRLQKLGGIAAARELPGSATSEAAAAFETALAGFDDPRAVRADPQDRLTGLRNDSVMVGHASVAGALETLLLERLVDQVNFVSADTVRNRLLQKR